MLALRRAAPSRLAPLTTSFRWASSSHEAEEVSVNAANFNDLRAAVLLSARATTPSSSQHQTFCRIVAELLSNAALSAPAASDGVTATHPQSSQIAAFQRRGLDCSTCSAIVDFLAVDAVVCKAFPLALLRDINAKRTSPSELRSITTELMHQIEMMAATPNERYCATHGDLGSGPVATTNERNRRLWHLYGTLCGVIASTFSSMPPARGAAQGVSESENAHSCAMQLNDICFWVREMADALRRAGAPLRPSQIALGSALPLIQHASPEGALLFRQTVSYVYNPTTVVSRPLATNLSFAAKVHFVCAVCVPFVFTHYILGYAGAVRRGLDAKSVVTILACFAAMYLLLFHKNNRGSLHKNKPGSLHATSIDTDRSTDTTPAVAGPLSTGTAVTTGLSSLSTVRASAILSALDK
jgi:hypothetical protein